MSIVSQIRPSQRSFSRLSYKLSKGFQLLTYYYLCQLFSWKEISFARKETRKWKKSKERTKSMHARNVYVSPVSPWKDDIVEGFSSDLEMIHFLETGRGEGGKEEKKKLVDDESAKEESDRPWLRAERVTGTERSGVERSQVVTDL